MQKHLGKVWNWSGNIFEQCIWLVCFSKSVHSPLIHLKIQTSEGSYFKINILHLVHMVHSSFTFSIACLLVLLILSSILILNKLTKEQSISIISIHYFSQGHKQSQQNVVSSATCNQNIFPSAVSLSHGPQCIFHTGNQ